MTIVKNLPSGRSRDFGDVVEYVKNIIEYVRIYGDKALIEFTKKFDGVEIESIKIDAKELEKCMDVLPNSVKNSIDIIYNHLFNIHYTTLPKDIKININGVIMGINWRSIYRIGIYVPGGAKSYPSTLLMAGVPAVVAGVKEIYISSPPMKNKCVDPAIAYIAMKISAKEVYRIGGAHAIAAMAYGTESVSKVDKIVGPGNIYVQVAKYLVQGDVDIDGVEGPTELVIIADEHADYRKIALDMMAQSEHGKDVLVMLLTPSDKLINEVEKELAHDEIHRYYLIKVKDIDEALEIANKLAPEHLSLYIKESQTYLEKVVNSGAITIDSESPSMIDYLGPNHILPTNGWAKTRGALTVYDFLKPIAILYNSKDIDKELLDAAKVLARYEGFIIHEQSIGVRYV
uniref:Histidinol dehydrogenase n=1 Tax=Ignisphaera aggregans TaxID=334771 RepID=A0A7C5THH9_9CREN